MAKRRREPDFDDTATEMAEYKTVFVDTSIDTHLAMLVTTSDTVSDFKKKIELEHMQCFPNIGEIQINSLKVKRRGNFYHLPDIMLVWSAFHGVKGNWFLSADASNTPTCHLNQNCSELGTSDVVKMDVRNVDDNGRYLSSDVNRIQTLPMSSQDGVTENNVVSEITAGFKVEKSLENATNSQKNIYAEENSMGTELRAKKKRKMRHTEDICHNASLKDSSAFFPSSGGGTSMPMIVGCGSSMVDAAKEGPEGIPYKQQGKVTMPQESAEVSGMKNDQPATEDVVVFEGTSAPVKAEKSNLGSIVDSQNLLGSDKRNKETVSGSIIPGNLMATDVESECRQDVPTEHSGGVPVKVPNLSAGLMDASGPMLDVNSDGHKKKKKKVQKTTAKIQETTAKEQTRKVEIIQPYTEPHITAEKEEEKGLSLNHDHEVIMPSSSKLLDHADPDFALKEESLLPQLLDSNAVMEPEISSGGKKKKKKRAKTSVDTDLKKSGIQQTDNGVSGSSVLLSPPTNHFPEETDKEESILYDKGKDVQVKLLDSSNVDASEKVQDANRNEVDFMLLTQTKKTLEDVATGEKKMGRGNQSPGGPLVEKENQIVESNQVEKDSENIIPGNLMATNVESDCRQVVPTGHSGGAPGEVPDLSAGLLDASGAMLDVNPDGHKRKKKKVQKTTAKIQETTAIEQTRKVQIVQPYTEPQISAEKEEEKGLALNHDHEVIMPSSSKLSDHADPDFALKEESSLPPLLDANAVMEPEISGGGKKKKKKREKKSVDTDLKKSGIQQTDNGVTGSSCLLSPPTDHFPEDIDKEESIMYHKGKGVQTKLLDSSNADASEEVQDANRNEADFMRMTQTKKTLEDVATREKNMGRRTQSSAGPLVEKENQIVESNQVEKDSENAENKDLTTKRKRKKRKPTASDVQENLPVKDQKVGILASTTEENSTSSINTERKGRRVSESQVLSCKSVEKLGEMHGTSVNTDVLARTSENESEGINFKQYFLPGQYEDKVDSSDKVKEATKSNKDMKTRKTVKENGFSSVSISPELQNSLKSFDNQERENKSRARKNTGRRQRDSAQNSDWDEVIPNSSKRSSEVSGERVKDASASQMCETTPQKPNEILDASSCPKENKTSPRKSSSGRSKTFPEKRGNERLQANLNVTTKMVMKTPKKKSLLTKSGAIFQDNSGESSGDENGNVHSDASTHSQSDSSSLSGYSVGESELSQDTHRNGSSDTKGRSTGGKSLPKLDLSASKDMTLDMILRSSKRFKKAKLRASQNELDQVEFVPESQPT